MGTVLSADEKSILRQSLDVMWVPRQSNPALAGLIDGLASKGMMEPGSRQFHDAPAGSYCVTEKGAAAIGFA